MNWRIILGLILLLVGMMELYSVMANSAAVALKMRPVYIEMACVLWICIGIFLMVQGIRNKGQ